MASYGLLLKPLFSDLAIEKHIGLEHIGLKMMGDFEGGDLCSYSDAPLNFASSMLELRSPFVEEVESPCRSEFPELWPAAKELVNAIHRHGLDTPERQCDLL